MSTSPASTSRTAAVVLEVGVGLRVVRDVQVDVSVRVVVGGDRAQRVARIVDEAEGLGRFHQTPVVVVVEGVASGGRALGPTGNEQPAPVAWLAVVRRVLRVVVDVVADVEIEVPVAVGVEERGGGGGARVIAAPGLGDVLERAVAAPAEEAVGCVVERDVQVAVPVAVEVDGRGAVAPAVEQEARVGAHVFEAQVAEVAVERVARRPLGLGAGEDVPVGKEEVEQPVLVDVDGRGALADVLGDGHLGHRVAADVQEREARVGADVREAETGPGGVGRGSAGARCAGGGGLLRLAGTVAGDGQREPDSGQRRAPQKVFEVTGRPVERPGVEGHGGRVYSSPMHRDALQHELVTEAP